MNAKQLAASLEAAIARRPHSKHPGNWSVSQGDGWVMLIWTCKESDLPEMYGEEPWTDWNGDAIAEDAAAPPWDESGIDATSQHGKPIVQHWVQWDFDDTNPDDDDPGDGAEPHADQSQPQQGTAGAADEHGTPGEAPRTLQT